MIHDAYKVKMIKNIAIYLTHYLGTFVATIHYLRLKLNKII
jgi:hypothetical protein